MGEVEILKKAYRRLEKLYTEEKIRNNRLSKKAKEVFDKNKELEMLVNSHIRLNKELNFKLKNLEKELVTLQIRLETGKISTQTNKKPRGNKIH